MYRPGLLVDRLGRADGFHDRIKRPLRDASRWVQAEVLEFLHHTCKNRALPASRRHHTTRGALRDVLNPTSRPYGGSARLPIDVHRFNIVDRFHQPLVSQVSNHECLWCTADRHESNDFAPIQVNRQRMLAGHADLGQIAALIQDGNLHSWCDRRVSEYRSWHMPQTAVTLVLSPIRRAVARV